MNILLIGGLGYIGSYLHQELISNTKCHIDIVDLNLRGNKNGVPYIRKDYNDITKSELQKYDFVLWFAGNSSVSSCINDPERALRNNCINLIDFCLKLNKNTRFIYASTASLYSKKSCADLSTENEDISINFGENPYDITKYAFDYLIKNYFSNFVGLRMGTLCGWSPNLRSELVFNSMHISASKNKSINLMNKNSERSILYLNDLSKFIISLINNDIEYGFYNASSEHYTMGELSTKISNFWGNIPILDLGTTPTYSFKIDNSKFKKIIGITSNFNDESTKFKINYEKSLSS